MSEKRAELAGSWYPGDAAALARTVDACVEQAEREYGEAIAAGAGLPVAVVVPHAGLAYSGPIAAAAYAALRRRLDHVDSFVVFGACHRASPRRPAIWEAGSWQTPLGGIAIDEGLAAALIADGAGVADRRPHHSDNAIELQTPFIKRLFPEAKMVPVAMGFFPDAAAIGEGAGRIARAFGGTVVAVASTDLTHYGAAFGLVPAGVGQPAVDWLGENDARFLDTLLALRLDDIVPTAERDSSACGAGAAAAAAGWARAAGCRRGRLLAAANSHDIAPRGVADHIVGYASVIFERE